MLAKRGSTLSFNASNFLVPLDVVWLKVLSTKCHAGHVKASDYGGKGGYKILEAVSGTLVSCILVLLNYLKVFLAVHGPEMSLVGCTRLPRNCVSTFCAPGGLSLLHSLPCSYLLVRRGTLPNNSALAPSLDFVTFRRRQQNDKKFSLRQKS